MPPKSIRMALADMLENLSKEDFEKFCYGLLSRKESPRVKRNRVEDKTRLQVADVLVSTFKESGARTVALEILEQIGCGEEAEALGKYVAATCLMQNGNKNL